MASDLNLKLECYQDFLKFDRIMTIYIKGSVSQHTRKKNAFKKNDLASLDIILGDNFRYNLDYYIENGFNISSVLNRITINLIEILPEISPTLQQIVNTINVDFSDCNKSVYFQPYLFKNFDRRWIRNKIFSKSETLANADRIIDRSNYFSIFSYVKYDSFDKKVFS
jgi:NTE family protein